MRVGEREPGQVTGGSRFTASEKIQTCAPAVSGCDWFMGAQKSVEGCSLTGSPEQIALFCSTALDRYSTLTARFTSARNAADEDESQVAPQASETLSLSCMDTWWACQCQKCAKWRGLRSGSIGSPVKAARSQAAGIIQ